MPTLVSELTPLQRMWLYENQVTRVDSRDSYEDRWTRMGTTHYSDDIFRSRPELPPPEHPMRKRKCDDECCIQISPSTCVRSPASPPQPQRPRHQAHSKGPQFPYHGDKLTWQQSLDNLKVYRDHYGNCNVPQKYSLNPKLGRWINKQRKKKKNPDKYGALTAEQIEQLEDLGFTWNQST